ncbi:MAG: peptidoglycan DD-metalloendopeptidase family protein [Burkholderiales bacterium]|nr:peptidoglycan DD-metalloendopeptidase family protein [Burkholderiales bacterium]
MKFSLLLIILLISGIDFAITSNEVNKNLSDINSNITQINSDLNKQQQQQQSIANAIKKSDVALNQSTYLLNNLKKQRDLSLQQLSSIQYHLTILSHSLLVTKTQSELLVNRIYQQIQRIKSQEQSILLGNDADISRKKAYLVTILQQEQNQMQLLQNKVNSLNVIINKLQVHINRLNKQLGATAQKQMQLKKNKDTQVANASNINSNIQQKQAQLSNLQHQQAKLNQIMSQILARQQNAKESAKKRLNNRTDYNRSLVDKDNGYDDNSPFLSRHLVKPIDATASLGFGQMRDNVLNKGILFNYVANAQVMAVASGNVMYSGDLPGFGKVIIIDHGNNYMSIYSGVISNVKVGNKVNTGQVIASTGIKGNQPLGGFYFELRHLGKPINPSRITG